MPSEPSMSCAMSPTTPSTMSLRMRRHLSIVYVERKAIHTYLDRQSRSHRHSRFWVCDGAHVRFVLRSAARRCMILLPASSAPSYSPPDSRRRPAPHGPDPDPSQDMDRCHPTE